MFVETERGLEAIAGQAAEDLADYRARAGEDASLARIAGAAPRWLHFSHGESVDLAGD